MFDERRALNNSLHDFFECLLVGHRTRSYIFLVNISQYFDCLCGDFQMFQAFKNLEKIEFLRGEDSLSAQLLVFVQLIESLAGPK